MLYVITAVHNRKNITQQFIDQLLSQTYNQIQLVLVDDGSTDGTKEMVQEKMPDAVVLCGNGKLWWGGAMSLAYNWVKNNCSDENYVLIANDDIRFDDSFVERAMKILSCHQNVLLTGCGYSEDGCRVDGAFIINYPSAASKLVLDNTRKNYGNCATTHCLFAKLSDYLKIGPFHPILLPHYGSDFEWTIRGCRKLGLRVLCEEDLKYSIGKTTKGYKGDYRIKNILSKRSMQNPFYKLNFIALSAPRGLKTKSIKEQIVRFWEHKSDLSI